MAWMSNYITHKTIDAIYYPCPNLIGNMSSSWAVPYSVNANALQWRYSASNHQPRDCLLNRLFRHKPEKTSRLRVTGLCEGNSPVTSEFPAQRASNAENVSIWWRHHGGCVVGDMICSRHSQFWTTNPHLLHLLFQLTGLSPFACKHTIPSLLHEDVMSWKRFPHYWSFFRGGGTVSRLLNTQWTCLWFESSWRSWHINEFRWFIITYVTISCHMFQVEVTISVYIP